jgi:exopolysaccharide biosynthesis polyprenyl glycosylphosphotransferase
VNPKIRAVPTAAAGQEYRPAEPDLCLSNELAWKHGAGPAFDLEQREDSGEKRPGVVRPSRECPRAVDSHFWLGGRCICFLADSAAVLLSLGLCYWVVMHRQTSHQAAVAKLLERPESYLLLLLLIPVWLLALQRIDYLRVRRTSVSATRPIFYMQFGLFAALGLFLWLRPEPRSSSLAALLATAMFLPASVLGRCILVFLVANGHWRFSVPHILLIGSGENTKALIKQLRNMDCKCRIVGCLKADPPSEGDCLEGVPILGSAALLREFIFHNSVDVVLFTVPLNRVPDGAASVASALDLGLHVGFPTDCSLPENLIPAHARVSLGLFPGVPVRTFSTVAFRPIYSLSKRLLDIIVSFAALVVLSPMMGVISLLIKLTSPNGPVLHRLDHVGINGRSMAGYKFRTMVPNAHSLKPQLMGRNKMTGPVFKIRDDPRVTPLGRWLRRYSLDELPQIYSVLKGELSLVGPRAPMREEAERFEYWQRRKLCVKPGLTCLWQVNGRSEITDFSEWVRLDLEYIRKASFSTDLKILFRTLPVVIQGRGAY